MRRFIKWFLIVLLLVVAYPVFLVSQDCTTNHLTLANNSAGPVDVTVWVRDENQRVWSGTLDNGPPVVVPFEMVSSEGSFEVEVRYPGDGRVTRSAHGYVMQFYDDMHFLVVTDSGVLHSSSWNNTPNISETDYPYWTLFKVGSSYLKKRATCVDNYLWQAG